MLYTLNKFLDNTIEKFSYFRIFVSISIAATLVLLASYFSHLSFNYINIISLITDIVFIVALFYLAIANIKTYFYFFGFFILKSFIALRGLLSMMDIVSLSLMLLLIIIVLTLLLHGLYKWNLKSKNGNIVPSNLQSNFYMLFILVFAVISIILGLLLYSNNTFSSIVNIISIFSLLNLIAAIILINEKKVQGLVFLSLYFISNIFVFKDFFLVQEILFLILMVFAYKFWQELALMKTKKQKKLKSK
ncbi:hypothetical protein ACFX5K_01415 [Rickettsiales bacterium LUAb2]